MRPTETWQFDYAVLAALTGLSTDTVRQHRSRRKFDPNNLESVVIYLAAHGTDDLRRRIIDAALWITKPEVPWQKRD